MCVMTTFDRRTLFDPTSFFFELSDHFQDAWIGRIDVVDDEVSVRFGAFHAWCCHQIEAAFVVMLAHALHNVSRGRSILFGVIELLAKQRMVWDLTVLQTAFGFHKVNVGRKKIYLSIVRIVPVTKQ